MSAISFRAVLIETRWRILTMYNIYYLCVDCNLYKLYQRPQTSSRDADSVELPF
jgi:hypothetical protein